MQIAKQREPTAYTVNAETIGASSRFISSELAPDCSGLLIPAAIAKIQSRTANRAPRKQLSLALGRLENDNAVRFGRLPIPGLRLESAKTPAARPTLRLMCLQDRRS